MPRSSRRASAVRAEKALAQGEASEDDDEFELDQEQLDEDAGGKEDYHRAPSKKGRTSRGGAAPKVKGVLKDLLDLPLEIVTLIFSHLDLPTVFHLSRLNKRFYTFLRDPTLEYVWELAREESGLPELTAGDMNVYGNCQGCGKATQKVDYILRIRSCKACSPKFIRDGLEPEFCYNWQVLDLAVESTYRGLRRAPRCEYALRNLLVLNRIMNRYYAHRDRRKRAEEEDDEDFDSDDSVSDDEDEDDDELVGATYAGWRSVKSQEQWQEFVDACSLFRTQRQEHGETLIDWVRQRELDKEQEKQAIRNSRRQAIKDRLAERGWLRHHFDNDDFKLHPLVCVAKELNDRAWSGMRLQLEKLLENAEDEANQRRIVEEVTRRQELLRVEHLDLREGSSAAAKAAGLYPLLRWDELVNLSSVQALCTAESVEETYDPDPSLKAAAQAISAELVVRCADLTKGIFDRLLVVLKQIDSTSAPGDSPSSSTAPKLVPDPDDGEEYSSGQVDLVCGRAVSLVKCQYCFTVDTISQLLTHQCKHRYTRAKGVSLDANLYTVSAHQVLAVLECLDIANKPLETTASEMDALGPGFTCSSPECSGCTAQPWQLFVKHLSSLAHDDRDSPGKILHTDKLVYEEREAVLERLYQQHLKSVREAVKRGEPMENS